MSQQCQDQPAPERRLTDRRARKLGEARADLRTLPDLLDELARCLTERGDTTGGKPGKISGSPPPLRLDVLHLVDPYRKPGWYGEDPRAQQIADRYGATAALETWVRVCWEELPYLLELTETPTARSETAVLIELWDWIEDQQWAEELAEDVIKIANQVRNALGVRPEYRPRCRYCRDIVEPVEADSHTATTWELCAYGLCKGCRRTYPKGPALDALAQVQRPMPLKEIAELTGVPLATLYRWYVTGAISPETEPGKKRGNLFDLAAVRAVATRVYGREPS